MEERVLVDMASGPPEPVDYPLCDDLSELEKAVIVEAVSVAWERLRARQGPDALDLRTAGETQITRELRNAVDALRLDPTTPIEGFDESKFQHIPEGEVTPDHTGLPAEKNQVKPDLVVRPVHVRDRLKGSLRGVIYGWYVECKIIDRTKSHGHHKVNEYCACGLMRFVSLEYACAMPSGLMIAYVRDGSDVPSCLHPYLAEPANTKTYRVQRLPAPRPSSGPGIRKTRC